MDATLILNTYPQTSTAQECCDGAPFTASYDKSTSMETETETSDLASKLATLKRITFKQAEALAAEKGATLICDTETKTRFRKGGRGTITITNYCYKLSTSDKEFSCLTDVRDFLLQ